MIWDSFGSLENTTQMSMLFSPQDLYKTETSIKKSLYKMTLLIGDLETVGYFLGNEMSKKLQ